MNVIEIIFSSKHKPKVLFEGRTYSICGPKKRLFNQPNQHKLYLRCDVCGLGRASCEAIIAPIAPQGEEYDVIQGTFNVSKSHSGGCAIDLNEHSARNNAIRLEAEKNQAIDLARRLEGVRSAQSIYREAIQRLQQILGEEVTANFVSRENFLQSCRRKKASMI